MIDMDTRRFCAPCSFHMWAYWRKAERAVEGLPRPSDISGKPVTDLLCTWHRKMFLKMPTTLAACDAAGNVETYANGVPVFVEIGEKTRPILPEPQIFCRTDILTLVEKMLVRLWIVEGMILGGYLQDTTEQPTVSLDEVIAWTELERAIKDFLKTERNPKVTPTPRFPFQVQNTLDDPDDQISGEEARKFFEHHPIDFDNRFGSEE